jgi:hypothetical protein
MMEDSAKFFDIHEFVAAKGLEKQNFESESSIQDCLILREKFGTSKIERCWISKEFRCTGCGRQLSIVDLFNSETMTHSPEFIRKALDSSSEDFEVIYGDPKRPVKVTCDCGKSDDYEVPEFAIKTGNIRILAYLRGCRACYQN